MDSKNIVFLELIFFSVPVPAIAATRRRKQSRIIASEGITQSHSISKTTLLARLMAKTSIVPRNPTLENNRRGERVLSAVVDLHTHRIPRGRHILNVIFLFSRIMLFSNLLGSITDYDKVYTERIDLSEVERFVSN